MNRLLKKWVSLLIIILIFFISNIYAAEYWPAKGWRSSTPEEQGMDSGPIVELLRIIKAQQKNIHSMLIIRNGYLVTEAYFAPYHRDVKQTINACTNSIFSALYGIALNEGYFTDLSQIIIDFFPERSIANLDTRKKEISLNDLLTMTSGLSWNESAPFFNKRNMLFQAETSKDRVQYILDRPMISQPGVRFNYNSGTVYLLAAILRKATGVNEAIYAGERLFNPLGITNIHWPSFSDETLTGNSLAMTPSDMAKFGYLYLNKGMWEGKQVIPAKWILESTKSYIGDHGYLWWRNPLFDGFNANGFGGQYIFIVPKYNLVAVFTGGLSGMDYALPQQWMISKIIPAVKSEQKLPPNPELNNLLSDIITSLQIQKPARQAELPEIAHKISGKTYFFELNNAGVSSIRFTFQKNNCLLWINRNNSSFEIPVGLDGCYRGTKINSYYYTFAKGHWRNQKTFLLDLQIPVEYPEIFEISLVFEKDQIFVKIRDKIAGVHIFFQGKEKV